MPRDAEPVSLPEAASGAASEASETALKPAEGVLKRSLEACPELATSSVYGRLVSFPYRVHDAEGDDLGVLVHPAPNVEAEDEVTLPDGRTAVVTRRVESTPGVLIQALLEVNVRQEDTRE